MQGSVAIACGTALLLRFLSFPVPQNLSPSWPYLGMTRMKTLTPTLFCLVAFFFFYQTFPTRKPTFCVSSHFIIPPVFTFLFATDGHITISLKQTTINNLLRRKNSHINHVHNCILLLYDTTSPVFIFSNAICQ